MNNLSRFFMQFFFCFRMSSKVSSRKRMADDDNDDPESLKKSKLSRLSALIDDEPLPPTVNEPHKRMAPKVPEGAGNISAIVADMKRQIEERKKMLSKYSKNTSL